ncbi:MAG: CARDB domain-containing protein, partial [Candidatus Binatia bacterium]
MRWRCKGFIVFLTALGLALLLISAGGAQEGQPDKGAPTPAEEPQGPACTLRRSGSISPQDEWLSCINVTAGLSNAPAVGETATLSFTVTADLAYEEAEISVELPSNFEFLQLPAEMQVATAPSSDGARPVSRVAVRQVLPAKQPQQYQLLVKAIAPGSGQIRVRATGPAPGRVDAGFDDVFLTVGETAADAKFGIDVSPIGAVAAISGVPTPLPLTGLAKLAPVEGMSQPESDEQPAAPGIACVVGGWFYVDTAGPTRPSRNFQVQAWDRQFPFDRLLATGVTDVNGRYRLCFDNSDPFPGAGTVDIFVLFISENSRWRVRRTGTNNNFVFRVDGPNDIPDGDFNFGNLQPGDNALMRGLQAFDAVNDAFFWIPGACWDEIGPCRQVVVNWAPNSVDGTFYSLGGNDVHLLADDPRSRILVLHEVGHGIMDDVYEDLFPPSPNCSPHFIPSASSAGCAWTEGWAEWFPATVYNRPVFEFANGAIQDLEGPTWGTGGWNNGDTVEGRVAGALIDISDSANEAFWDRFSEFPGGPGNIWRTFQNNVSNTFAQFWAQRGAGGFNVAPTGALASVYQNTIDYNFRDPLGNYVQLTRPTPTPHNYSYNTTSNFWSVVAIRPVTADYDLQLFDNFAQTVLLGSSTFGGNTIDFVAVDSNIRPLGDYFPRVLQFSGTGNYQIELAQGTDTLPDGSQTIFMGAGDVVVVRDTFLNAGVPYRFRVMPTNAGQDPELFLMAPNPPNPVRARINAVASSTGAGPGGTEQFTFTPTVTGWHGLVLTSRAGSGNYTLSREVFRPDLLVQSIVPTPASPIAGQPVNVTVTVGNQGPAAAGAFFVDWYANRATPPPGPPDPARIGNFSCNPAGLAAGATTPCTGTFTYITAGNFNMWAQVDTERTVAETNENNNIFGPQAITVQQPFNYSLANSGIITVIQGASGSNTITATLVSGATQSVSFAATGLPAGATATFSPPPASCNPTCSKTLTIATTGATPTGTFPITVTGAPLGRTTTFNLTVNPQQFTLTVNLVGTGSGIVTGPGGISCPGVCSAILDRDTVANLAGIPDAGSFHASWDVCSGTSDCSVTMSADMTVEATFDLTLVFFSPPTDFGVGTAPSSVAVANTDINLDGIADLAVANSGSNDVAVLLGDGLGGFTAAAGSPFGAGTNPSS